MNIIMRKIIKEHLNYFANLHVLSFHLDLIYKRYSVKLLYSCIRCINSFLITRFTHINNTISHFVKETVAFPKVPFVRSYTYITWTTFMPQLLRTTTLYQYVKDSAFLITENTISCTPDPQKITDTKFRSPRICVIKSVSGTCARGRSLLVMSTRPW